MTNTNDYKQFSGGSGANVISQSDYLSLSARTAGFSSGYAYSNQVNKAIRQASAASAVIGQIIADFGTDAIDDGDMETLEAHLLSVLSAIGHRVAAISTAGTSTWTVPANVYGATVYVYGGGGGADNTSTPGGGGGGGGSCAFGYMTMTPGASIAYTVGAAGTNGSGSAGTNGGTSSFGPSGGKTFVAVGGGGSSGNGGSGGVASGGDANLTGQDGGDSYQDENDNGDGGDAAGPHGGKGAKIRGYGAAAAASAKWPGGGGATHSSTGYHTSFPGAAGGIIIIY